MVNMKENQSGFMAIMSMIFVLVLKNQNTVYHVVDILIEPCCRCSD